MVGVRDLDLRRLLTHGACFLGVFAAVLAPWYVRNYYCCGHVFLSKTAGLTMWQSLFKSNSPLDPAMPFADAPKTKALLARLEGVDLQRHWDVLRALEKQELHAYGGHRPDAGGVPGCDQGPPLEVRRFPLEAFCLVLDHAQRHLPAADTGIPYV